MRCAALTAILALVETGLYQELRQTQAAQLARFAPEPRVQRIRWTEGETQIFELGRGSPPLYVHGGLGGARVPGAGHNPWFDDPETVVAEPERLLAERPRR
jgi:hypothetical protein